MATFETSLKSRLIYVFAISDEWHKDCLKVGETTLEEDDGNFPLPNSEILNKAACDRIDQYTKTAGIAYTLLHTEMTVFFKVEQLAPSTISRYTAYWSVQVLRKRRLIL